MSTVPARSSAIAPAPSITDPQGRVGYRRGTHRVVPPEVTWARIRGELARFGITRVADVTGLDQLGVPVFQAVRPTARTVSVSQGKGVDPAAARVSAAMEAIELWHAEHVEVPDTRPVPARDLALPYPLAALDLAEASLVHPGSPLHWLPGTGVLTGDVIPVPLELVRLDHTFVPRWRPPLFRATSNGLASGNTTDEAVAHALAELCERDALAVLREQPSTSWSRLDLATVPDADVRAVAAQLAADGSTVEVVVATTAPACLEARVRSPLHAVTFTGAGCHLDPVVALLRALTEAAQSRLTAITGARDDLPDLLYGASGADPVEPPPADLRWAQLPVSTARGDVAADAATLARLVADRTGYEPIAVPLSTTPGIAVVKVVAPGLRFDDRVDVSRPAGAAGAA